MFGMCRMRRSMWINGTHCPTTRRAFTAHRCLGQLRMPETWVRHLMGRHLPRLSSQHDTPLSYLTGFVVFRAGETSRRMSGASLRSRQNTISGGHQSSIMMGHMSHEMMAALAVQHPQSPSQRELTTRLSLGEFKCRTRTLPLGYHNAMTPRYINTSSPK